jgi:LL-diaminopimelate aminotransferase
VDGLNSLGWPLSKPKGTFYVWAPVPQGYDSGSFAEEVFEKTKVVLTPGAGFGRLGEGYFRAALTTEESRMAEAISRIRKAFGGFEF